MDVLVTGSSGFIGSALLGALAADGHRPIRALRGRDVPKGVDAISWDPDAGTIDAGALEGIGAVVHLAGAGIGDARWTDARKRLILESRTIPTRLLATTLAGLAKPPAVLVSASAIGYYGDRGDESLTEDSAPGTDFAADVAVQWEAAAQPAADAGIRVATIRTGIVLGPGGGVLGKLLVPFKLGLGGRVGDGRQYMSWISLPDEVGAIRHVLRTDSLMGAVNLTAPNPVTNAELASTLGKVLHRPTVLPTPVLPLKARFGTELVQSLLLGGQRVLPKRLEASGFEFAHPTLEGALRAVLDRPAEAA
ncbi:MAG: TIGR01777 family oxidoreductase [Acidimicrobiia bacterium]